MAKLQFIHANVFDGDSDALKTNQTVTVSAGTIESVTDYQDEAVQPDTRVIDASGMTLLPGLIDAHINLVGLITEEQPMGVVPRTVGSSVLRGVKGGRRCIEHGVTTLRVDSNGHHGTYALRDAFDAGDFLGPHMILPGRPICTTCGHGWNFGNHIADGPWEVRKAVREEIMHGAEWIKLMATGGAGTATERIDDQQMCKAELQAGIEEAHHRGRKVFAHLTITQAIYDCLEAGIDSVEHGILMDASCAKAIQDSGAYLVPTIGVYRQLVIQGEKGLVPSYMYEKSKQIVKQHTESFHHALNAGVKIVAGTDSGQDWFPPGSSLLWELEIMSGEGLGPVETLKSATSRCADMLERPELGRVAAGKRADLVLVAGNPTKNITDIRNTRFVVKGGDLVYETGAEQCAQ